MIGGLTATKAAERIFGESTQATRKAIHRLVAQGADGPFPGAAKLDPAVANSPIVIPLAEVEAYVKQQKKTK